MGNAYTCCYLHYVFSTKNREPYLTDDVADQMYPYMAGITQSLGATCLAINGPGDHLHMLVQLPSTVTIAGAIQQVKGKSSYWIKRNMPATYDFAWQVGYGAFSVGTSQLNQTKKYIRRQKDHHTSLSYIDELKMILQKYQIPFDDKYFL